MSLEIERKWRVATLPEGLADGVALRQGYLATGASGEVRLRDKGGRLLLTVKRGSGLTRTEVEVDIAPEQFAALWPLTAGARVEKHRHALPCGELCIEVDVFEGDLAGLLLAEVEFSDEAAATSFTPPGWFGTELTGRPGWSNGELACSGLPTAPE